MRLFTSYSHKDERALGRLHTHLAVLQREGKIDRWYDREIIAGENLDSEIASQLDASDVFMPLVSPDFLASQYCYEREMEKAIERHENGTMRIVPVILDACDWKATPLRRYKALPKDGRPVAEWANENIAFLDIVTEVRRLIDGAAKNSARTVQHKDEEAFATKRAKYRLRRDFDDIDKGDYRRASFKEIKEYFEASTREINSIDGIKGRLEDIDQRSFTCTIINYGLERGTAHITVHMSASERFFHDIYYSFDEHARANTASGGFDVTSDEYDLFLKVGSYSYSDEEKLLTPQQAAEELWAQFLHQAGIDSE